MASNVDKFQTNAEHNAVDHTAAPFNLLSTAAHGSLNHAGITGVGVDAQNNGGAAQGPRARLNFIPSGAAGIAVVDNPGQSRIDVTVSAPSLPVFHSITLDATATAADINAALVAYNVVYLKPGVYTLAGTTITVPDEKQLIGLGTTAILSVGPSLNASVVLDSTRTTGDVILINERCQIRNIAVRGPGTSAATAFRHAPSDHFVIDNCSAHDFATGIGFEITGGAGRISSCFAIECGTGFEVTGDGGPAHVQVVEDCGAHLCTTMGFLLGGTNCKLIVRGCRARQCGTGFQYQGTGLAFLHLSGCFAYDSTGDGFSITNNHRGMTITGNYAESSGAWGIDFNIAGTPVALVHSNTGYLNTSGNFNLGPTVDAANNLSL